eukprot:COSAG01_NODE_96_length_26789_cov_36.697089_36_plen_167_part_00
MHEILVQTMSWDGLACEPNTAVPLLLHWGNVREAHTCLDKTLSNVAIILKKDGPVTQETLTAACTLPTFLLTLGRRQEAVELMRKLQIDGERIDRTVQVRLHYYVYICGATVRPIQDVVKLCSCKGLVMMYADVGRCMPIHFDVPPTLGWRISSRCAYLQGTTYVT